MSDMDHDSSGTPSRAKIVRKARIVFNNLTQPLSEELLKVDQNTLRLSAIDDRLPDVEILSKRYFDGRPEWAARWVSVNMKAWVCPCRIAGIVYNRPESKCGYCAGDSSRKERLADWAFPSKEDNQDAWALERLDPNEVQPFSKYHRLSFPTKATPRGGNLWIEKSGVLFVILRAIGFDHATSYRTAAQVIAWKEIAKAKRVIELLIKSDELAEIKAVTRKIYEIGSENYDEEEKEAEGIPQETFQSYHDDLGQILDHHLNDLVPNATRIASRHRERTSSSEYQNDLHTLDIEYRPGEPPRAVQKHLTNIIQDPDRSREHIALAGRLLDELNQELGEIDSPRHKALKDLAKVRDEFREKPDSEDERRRKELGEVEGFSL